MPPSLLPMSIPTPTSLADLERLLISLDRNMHDVLPDGNCMFRALSHQLYGNDKHHIQVRSMLLEVIQHNYITYQPYWIEDMPWGKMTFDEHVQKIACAGSWGTQVELQALSDCFNMQVFVCSLSSSRTIRWERKATPKNHGTIAIPPLSLQPTLPFTHDHVELCYNNYHYRSVVPTKKDTKLLAPVIVPRHSDGATSLL